MAADDGPKIPGELSPKQEAVISSLLVNPTLAAAAKEARVNVSSLRRWMKDPVFVAAYEQARGRVVESSLGLIQSAVGDALAAMRRACNNSPAFAEQHQASALILQSALKGIEFMAFNERLMALERQAAAMKS